MSNRQRSIAVSRSRYMIDGDPPRWPPTSAPVWHMPLLGAGRGAPSADINEKMQRAGTLWLQNYDLCFFCSLILSCPTPRVSFVFCRATMPDEPYQVIGPVDLDLIPYGAEVRSREGVTFRFAERNQPLEPGGRPFPAP